MFPRKARFLFLLLTVAWRATALGQAAAPPAPGDLLAVAQKEVAAGNPDAALKAFDAARQAAALASDDASQAAALLGMATIEFDKGDYNATARHAAESLASAEKAGKRAAQADALKLIGNVQYQKGDFLGSRSNAERVLAIREELGDRAGIAVALNNVATSYKFTDPLRSIDYLERSQKEFEALGDGRRATVLSNIADAYQNLGDFSRALEYCRLALALAEANQDLPRIARTMNLLGVIEMYRGDDSEALSSYEKALELHRKADFAWGEAEVLNNIGLVYQFQRNHPQAIAYLSRALELNRKIGDESLEAEIRNNLAQESLALGRTGDAEHSFRESLALSRRYALHDLISETLIGLARLDARRGRRVEAGREIDEAIAVARAVPDRRLIADSLVQLSFLRLDSSRPREALAVSKEAAEAASSAEDSDALWQAQLVAGKALRRLHRVSEAAAALDAAIGTIENQRARIAGPAESQPLYFADKLEPYQERVALCVAAGKTEEALRIVEQSKSRVLYDVLRSGRVPLDRALTSDERDRERSLQNELVSLNIGIEKQPADSAARTKRDEKRRKLEALQTTLYAEHPDLAFQRGAASALSVAEMFRLATQTRAVLLDYFVTPDRTYLFILSPGSKVRILTLRVRQTDIVRSTAELRRQLASHDLGYAETARELYRQLLAPAARDLAGASAAVVVPDGPLWNVPFGALEPRAGHFWIEDAAVSYAPSLGVLRETLRIERARSASPAPRELLALGNPKTNAPALPDAERQVREIGNLYGARESEILVGQDASEHRFKGEAPEFQVLHLASHAVLDDVNPMYSHVLLANGGGDDGLLEARKLMDLDLKAEMLVLSGCETARGVEAPGEGITGMLWASFVAGVPTTVASLWRVESASTSELMIEFHRRWLASRGKDSPFAKAEALRAAARKLIASGKYSHPFYWAGFILAGSP